MKSKRWAVGVAVSAICFAAFLVAGIWLFRMAQRVDAASGQIDNALAQAQPAHRQQFEHVVMRTAPAVPPTDNSLYSYPAPEGFVIKSYSSEWTEDKLALLYEELLKNAHGSEIETLREIIIMAEDDEYAAAMHSSLSEPLGLQFLYGPLPASISFSLAYNLSNITLYGGNYNTTVESMAANLSHEYGHLYTFYYMFGSGSGIAQTEYARLRQSDAYNLITGSWGVQDYYYDNHHQYLIEVAAEDYVQLMGSPTTRQTTRFTDVRQYQAGRTNVESEMRYAINARPQENMTIPLANEMEGLAEYFYSFIDEDPPETQYPRQEVTLQITPGSSSYHLETGYQTYVHYTLQWNTPYENAIYTVACYNPDDYSVIPVKTVYPGEAAVATVGSVAYESGGYVYYSYDNIASGTMVFYVTALLPDGTYHVSEKLEYTF